MSNATQDPESAYDYVELIFDGEQTSIGLNGYSRFDWPLYKLAYPLQNVKQFKVLEVSIPASYYSIQSWNNTFRVTIGATSYTVTIPAGNYDNTTIAAALYTALTSAVANGWVVTFSNVTNKLTFTGTSAFSFTFLSATGDSDAALIIGFTPNTTVASVAGSITAPNVVNLSGPNWIYIYSTKLGSFISTYTAVGPLFDGNQNIVIAKVPVSVNTSGTLVWQDPAPDHWFNVENLYNLNELDVYLMSPEKQLLQLNGLPWSIKIGIVYQTSAVSKDRESQFQANRVVKRIRPY